MIRENLILAYGTIPMQFIMGVNRLQYKLLYDIIENALIHKVIRNISA